MQVTPRVRSLALGTSASLLLIAFVLGAWQSLGVDRRLPMLALSYNWWLKKLDAEGDLERSIAQRRIAAAIDHSSSLSALRGLALAYRDAGRHQEELETFERIIDLDPQDASSRNDYAAALASFGRTNAAIAELEIARRLDSERTELRENLEVLLAHRREVASRRLEALRSALSDAPDRVGVANELAWILATHPDPEIRRPGEAVEHALAASRSVADPDPAILDTLACAFAAAGRFPEAVSAGRAAVEIARNRGSAELVAELRDHLSRFERGQAFIDSSD